MTTRTAPTTEELVAEVKAIDARLDELKTRRADLIAELAKLPSGSYDTFTVKPPSRRFDHERAYASLPEPARVLCIGPIPALVKAQIPPAALAAFMMPGNGANVVTIR